MRSLIMGILMAGESLVSAGDFVPCPTVDVTQMTAESFWQMMEADPTPKLAVNPSFSHFNASLDDFLSSLGVAQGKDGSFHSQELAAPEGYTLQGKEYLPGMFGALEKQVELPGIMNKVNMRPVLSIGYDKKGEKDLQHHYHGYTMMLLLGGEKVWALRHPEDPDCGKGTNNCTDPFEVCDYVDNEEPGHENLCVQKPGQVLVLPDAWYHGTCNRGLTVGWAFQGMGHDYTIPCLQAEEAASKAWSKTISRSVIVDGVLGASDRDVTLKNAKKIIKKGGRNFKWEGTKIGARYVTLYSNNKEVVVKVAWSLMEFIMRAKQSVFQDRDFDSPDDQYVWFAMPSNEWLDFAAPVKKMKQNEVVILVNLEKDRDIELQFSDGCEAKLKPLQSVISLSFDLAKFRIRPLASGKKSMANFLIAARGFPSAVKDEL